MNSLQVSLLQYNIAWEDKASNFSIIKKLLSSSDQQHDIIILPEMFSTGFSMKTNLLAEENTGETIRFVKTLSRKYNAAICGSFIAKDGGNFYNRGFFITPEEDFFYDKRHLFRMGNEADYFSAGNKQLIVPFRGFNISLLICYDLRFPIWSRNVNNQYDLLIYVANWPETRAKVWNALLTSRALENLSYVCGVNRIGIDGTKLNYAGDSQIVDFKGDSILRLGNDQQLVTAELSKERLDEFRRKFPVWRDADKFQIF